MKNITDTEILALYSIWSEEYYCANFLVPHPETIKEFRNWLKSNPKPLKDYEQEMLEEFHRQKQEKKEE